MLANAPGAVAATLAYESGRRAGAFLIVGQFIAYAAAVTSLGLALSTWMHQLDYAVAANSVIDSIGFPRPPRIAFTEYFRRASS